MIHYDDFCRELELESRKISDVSSSLRSHGRIVDDRDMRDSGTFTRGQSTPRFRSSYDGSFEPIRVTESALFSRSGKGRYNDVETDSLSSSLDFRKSGGTTSPRRPRSPPSKVPILNEHLSTNLM